MASNSRSDRHRSAVWPGNSCGNSVEGVCKTCLDWSERRSHLGGALRVALLNRVLERGWARRGPGRVIAFSADGLAAMRATFGETFTASTPD